MLGVLMTQVAMLLTFAEKDLLEGTGARSALQGNSDMEPEPRSPALRPSGRKTKKMEVIVDDASHFQMQLIVDNVGQLLRGSNGTCKKKIYNLGFEELERDHPDLAVCGITTYADLMSQAFEQSPCKVGDVHSADVVMAPGYLSWERNWPHYGGGDANMKRTGKDCDQQAIDALLAWVPTSKNIFVIDSVPQRACNKWPDRILLASINAMTSCSRRAFLSMPPPPTSWANFDETRWDRPLTSTAHFASFVGSLNRGAVRKHAATLFHNPPRFIVEDSADFSENQRSERYRDALYNSEFVLILRGDNEFSYRFNEAVCSGGIPVLVTDVWVPPLEPVEPFKNYGVMLQEANLDNLANHLESIDEDTKSRLRQQAKRICETKLHDMAHQAAFAVEFLTGVSA